MSKKSRPDIVSCTHNERHDALLDQFFEHRAVMLDAQRVQRIVSAAVWDDPRPRNRESVCFDAVRLEQRDVLFP